MMGYANDIAKRALIETKNVGLIEAIDAIPDIQKSIKDSKKPKTNKILKSWSCPDCTFINNPNTHFCEVCEKEAPESAYTI